MSHSEPGQRGQGQNPQAVLHDMVSQLIGSQIDGKHTRTINDSLRQAETTLRNATDMTQQQLRDQGTHRTVDATSAGWLDQQSRQYASGILNMLDNKRDQTDPRFDRACEQAIGQVYPVFDQIGQQSPAVATTFVQASSGGQPGGQRGGKH